MAKDEWQPIGTAPRGIDDEILIYTGFSYHVAHYGWDDEDGNPLWFNGDVAVEATHWMPLPDAPLE